MNSTFEENSCEFAEKYYRERFDGFRCFLLLTAKWLYKIEFGYICASISLLLAFISIFGGIKENYRWFILNQVIWDALMSSNFICENVVGRYLYRDNKRCNYFGIEFLSFLAIRIPAASYPSLLLLSFSRFLCLYFSNFYEKVTKGGRIFITIGIFNFIMICTSLEQILKLYSTRRSSYLTAAAGGASVIGTKLSPTSDIYVVKLDQPLFKNDFLYQALKVMYNIQVVATNIKPAICISLSIFATIMIILKISKQFKFQRKNNRKDFFISLRITAVITFQTFMYSIFFFMEGVYDLTAIFLWNSIPIDLKNYLGKWCLGEFGVCSESMRTNLMEIRVFIESCIILCIMSGYREAVIKFVKFILKRFGCKNLLKNTTPVAVIRSEAAIVDFRLSHHHIRGNRVAPQN